MSINHAIYYIPRRRRWQAARGGKGRLGRARQVQMFPSAPAGPFRRGRAEFRLVSRIEKPVNKAADTRVCSAENAIGVGAVEKRDGSRQAAYRRKNR